MVILTLITMAHRWVSLLVSAGMVVMVAIITAMVITEGTHITAATVHLPTVAAAMVAIINVI